jgi:hypothetical protein
MIDCREGTHRDSSRAAFRVLEQAEERLRSANVAGEDHVRSFARTIPRSTI